MTFFGVTASACSYIHLNANSIYSSLVVRSNEWVSGSVWIYIYSEWQKVGSMEPMEPWLNPPLCIRPKQVYTCS